MPVVESRVQLSNRIYHFVRFTRPLAAGVVLIVFLCSSITAICSSTLTSYNLGDIFLGAVTMSLLSSASYALNNLSDIEIDRINKPFRALPSGKISVKEAAYITLVLYSIALVLSFLLPHPFPFLFLTILFFSVFYSTSPFSFKRHWLSAALTIGITRGFLLVAAGWSMVTNSNQNLMWYIGLMSFTYLLGAAHTKDFLDTEGDKNCRVSLPIRYGRDTTTRIISPFLLLPFAFFPIGVYFNLLKSSTLLLTLLCIYGVLIALQLKRTPYRRSQENNHISWAHSYCLYVLIHVGIAVAYVVG
jgi:geranylgeranylglycerol-phosphate geranylgeranyltransferase